MKHLNHTLQVGIAVSAAIGGAVHAYLYVDGYREIPTIGTAFLIQGTAMCAVALLIFVGGPMWLSLVAGAGAAASLGAFAMSRTVGLFGFTETGWEPTPYALLSAVAEGLAFVLAVALVLNYWRSRSPETSEAKERTAQPAGERLG